MSKTEAWFKLAVKTVGEACAAYVDNMDAVPATDLTEKFGSLAQANEIRTFLKYVSSKCCEVQ